jgi:hypothetical protein
MATFPVITAATFVSDANFSDFNGESTTFVQTWLDFYSRFCAIEEWGINAEMAVMLLTAHYLALNTEEGTVTISNAKAIDTGESMSNRRSSTPANSTGKFSDVYLSRTTYGQQFLMLKELVLSGGLLSGDSIPAVPPFIAF